MVDATIDLSLLRPVIVSYPNGTAVTSFGGGAGAGDATAANQVLQLAQETASAASLTVLDDWDESDRAKVNPIVGQAGITAGAGAVAANTPRTTLASDDPAVAALGAITGAAVITDANGTIQQYLRGIVKLLITAGTVVLGAGAAIIGKVGIDQTTPGTTNGVVVNRNERSATGTQSIVASSATSVTVLAANANRYGGSVYNDSTQILYLLLTTGGTASATVYTVAMAASSYFEIPFGYTGALIGLWASANGNARVMEYT